MPPPLGLDWNAIRREWESTDVADLALAVRWGLKSGTSIRRRREAEAWHRDAAANVAAIVVRAAREAGQAEGRTRGAHTHTHTKTQQGGRSGSAETAGVCTDRAKSASPTQPGKSPHAHEAAADDIVQRVVARTPGLDLAALRTQELTRELRNSALLVDAGVAWIGIVTALASAPNDGSDPKQAYANAVRRLGGINPDKDSITAMLKAASNAIAEGTKIARDALGLDLVVTAQVPIPGGAVLTLQAAEIAKHLPFTALEKLAFAADQATRMRPQLTIEGEPSPTGAPSARQPRESK